MQVRSMYCASGTKQLENRPLKQIFEPCYKMWYRENPSFSFSSSSTAGWFGWLNLLNAELSPKRYWMGPTSQEVEEEGDYT